MVGVVSFFAATAVVTVIPPSLASPGMSAKGRSWWEEQANCDRFAAPAADFRGSCIARPDNDCTCHFRHVDCSCTPGAAREAHAHVLSGQTSGRDSASKWPAGPCGAAGVEEAVLHHHGLSRSSKLNNEPCRTWWNLQSLNPAWPGMFAEVLPEEYHGMALHFCHCISN